MRTPEWCADGTLVVDGVTFVPTPPGAGRFASSSTRFCLVKRADLVRDHLALLAEARPRVVVELGVLEGGSTALTALVAEPDALVAVELTPPRSPGLADLVRARGLEEQVRVHHGVDQGDRESLNDLLDTSLGDRAIDLVVDDASHSVEPTRASFNVLFPRLRPGGLYVIEDWSWAHLGYGAHRPGEVPLTTVVFEVVMALPSVPGLMREIRVTRDWVAVVRGDGPVDAAGFDLSAAYSDRGRDLLAR